jgi:Na+-translocating ferredoxin:NAD+ oxidoreductase RnfD subunit
MPLPKHGEWVDTNIIYCGTFKAKPNEAKMRLSVMAQDDKFSKELSEIKALLTRAQRRADIQWVYSIGFAAVIGSLALLAIKAAAWAILLTFLAGFVLMILAPYFARK